MENYFSAVSFRYGAIFLSDFFMGGVLDCRSAAGINRTGLHKKSIVENSQNNVEKLIPIVENLQ